MSMASLRFGYILILATPLMAWSQTATFQGTGDLAGGFFFATSHAVSRDGSTIVGQSGSFLAPYGESTMFTFDQGLQGIGVLPGHSQSAAAAVSSSGEFIAGYSVNGPEYTEAYLWSESRGMIGLGHLPGGTDQSLAFGISGNGRVVVGSASSEHDGRSVGEAFRWTEQTGMHALGHLATDPDRMATHARAVSARGTVIVGTSATNEFGSEAFRWTENEGMVGLGDLPGGFHRSTAWAVSSDGSWVVGSGSSDEDLYNGAAQAVRWHPNGELEPLGFLPGDGVIGGSGATSVSDNGQTVVGWAQSSGFQDGYAKAVIWLPGENIRTIESILLDYGIDVAAEGWRLERANSISGDGRTITGTGTIQGLGTQGWVVTLPVPAPTTLAPLAALGLAAARRRR